MQPSEVDRLSTYEFNKYIKLLEEQMKYEKEYDITLAKSYGVGGLLSSKD